MTTSWSRSPLWHLQYSRDNVKPLHKLSKWCWWRGRSVIICLRLNQYRNPQFGCAVLLISFTEEIRCILPSWLCQFVKLHLLLPKALHALLYCCGDCAHHPAGLVIFAMLAQLCHFILIFPILPIIGTCKITQIVYDSSHHLLKSVFGLSGRQSCDFSMHHIVLLLLNRCLCVFNSLYCPSGLSPHNPQSISLGLHCLRSAFLVIFLPQASFWISICARPPGLVLSRHPSRSYLHSHDDDIGFTALSICRICQPEVAKSSFSEHAPL